MSLQGYVTHVTFNRLQPISTSLWMVLNDFWNEATGNQNNPKFGQPQPKNRPVHGPVQFGPMDFFSP